MADDYNFHQSALVAAKKDDIQVGEEVEVEDSRLKQLYSQVTDEADKRNDELKKYTNNLFESLKTFIVVVYYRLMLHPHWTRTITCSVVCIAEAIFYPSFDRAYKYWRLEC